MCSKASRGPKGKAISAFDGSHLHTEALVLRPPHCEGVCEGEKHHQLLVLRTEVSFVLGPHLDRQLPWSTSKSESRQSKGTGMSSRLGSAVGQHPLARRFPQRVPGTAQNGSKQLLWLFMLASAPGAKDVTQHGAGAHPPKPGHKVRHRVSCQGFAPVRPASRS